MEFNVLLEVFFILLVVILVSYVVYTKYIKKSSSLNDSNFIFTPKYMFNYSPELLNTYLNEKTDLNGYEDGFKATVLDLINKNYIIFSNPVNSNSAKTNNHSYGPLVRINKKKSVTKLKAYELDVVNFLKRYDKKGVISLYFIEEDLKNLKASKKFESRYNSWEKHLKNEYSNNKFFRGDSTEFMDELDNFKSYVSGRDITNADISLDDINQFLVYGMALGIGKKAVENFEKYLDETTLKNSEIYQIIKVNGINFVEQGFKGLYLVKPGQHDSNTDVYGY
ncbi:MULTISPECIES: DUF2207 family protein [Methanobacterium]|uniref:Predicted membrane protein YciQ-like C-terminal domain-containing protein n=1 Tax=Methanobacterium bryantii TaxID=2161 RepID=A0A2A2H935_METBR|nr:MULTISPECIES: DUF2207 domain-containing protein [Methanobacterium]OEC85677.1 hypothetical protein A9507_13040 [Methanobacterium sp. A39]PAV05888.1 hypothetical protein ASJ80_13580 [Methanobacterium bryantii]